MKLAARRRPGFTLLEVLVAFTIFMLSLVGISQLLHVASAQVQEARYTNRAAQLLQSQMNRVIAGDVALTSATDATFDEDQSWTWSIDAEADSTIANLFRVTITVSHARPEGGSFQASLSQMVLDPATKGTIESSSSSSGTTPSGGN